MNFFSLFKRNLIYKIKQKTNIDLDNITSDSLDKLFQHYGSDKATILNKTNGRGHGFSKFYCQNLNSLKKKKIEILEIGSYAGASAAAFVKYFENSSVYCFDVNISKFNYYSKKIHVYGLDINNKSTLDKVLKKINLKSNLKYYDLIIDDGSHYLSDILNGLKNLFKEVKKGGFYIIEDYMHPNYYHYNRDIDHILVDEVLLNLKEKKFFISNILREEDQTYLHKNIKKIKIYKGDLKDSDICFIEKN